MHRKKYQVFVSSTYRGLEEERRQVMQALLEMDCVPSGMELFPASTDDVWTLIESVIAEADYYVVIVGGRYGSTDADGISYTEREYDLAAASEIPVLPFLHRDPGKIPAELTEMDADARRKLSEFREKVEGRHHCKYWTSAAELGGMVSRSVNLLIRTNPRVGWVRGDLAKTIEEVERANKLQQRVRELEDEVEVLRQEAEGETSIYAQGDEVVPTDRGTFLKQNGSTSDLAVSWNEVFVAVAQCAVSNPVESMIGLAVQGVLARKAAQLKKGDVGLARGGLEIIKRQFLALGLIELEHVEVEVTDPSSVFSGQKHRKLATVWRLTAKGSKHFARLTAIRAEAPQA